MILHVLYETIGSCENGVLAVEVSVMAIAISLAVIKTLVDVAVVAERSSLFSSRCVAQYRVITIISKNNSWTW